MIKDMFKVFKNMCRHEKYELRNKMKGRQNYGNGSITSKIFRLDSKEDQS